MLGEVAVDGCLEVDVGFEDAAPDASLGEAEKKFSAALIQEPEVGVKWNTHRG